MPVQLCSTAAVPDASRERSPCCGASGPPPRLLLGTGAGLSPLPWGVETCWVVAVGSWPDSPCWLGRAVCSGAAGGCSSVFPAQTGWVRQPLAPCLVPGSCRAVCLSVLQAVHTLLWQQRRRWPCPFPLCVDALRAVGGEDRGLAEAHPGGQVRSVGARDGTGCGVPAGQAAQVSKPGKRDPFTGHAEGVWWETWALCSC